MHHAGVVNANETRRRAGIIHKYLKISEGHRNPSPIYTIQALR